MLSLSLALFASFLLPRGLSAAEIAESRVVIGLLLPPEEPEAASLRQGVDLGVEQANRSPGPRATVLIRGRVGQWGTDGEEAGRMVLDEGVRGIIAPPGGAPSHLALQIAGRTATPVITLCPDTSVTRAGVPWMVRSVASTEEEARLIFSTLKPTNSSPGYHWAALVPEERAGREAAIDLQWGAHDAGVILDTPIRVSSKSNNLVRLHKAILASKPNGILLWQDPVFAGVLARSLRAAGFEGRLAGPSRLSSQVFTKTAGDAAEGCVVPAPMRGTSGKEYHRFVSAYREHFGGAPDYMACAAYDAATLLIDVLRRAGDRPPHSLFPLQGTWFGANGRLAFNRKGELLVALQLQEFRSGRLVSFAGQMGQE